jgi:hypothetical protein
MKKYKIFNVFWHVAHQYSLYQIPGIEWSVLLNTFRKWKTDARPLPEGVKIVPYYEPGKYDVAVLHIDQQCIDPAIGKGQLYRQLNNLITDIPKIVINHGTPFWPEKWNQQGRHSWSIPLELLKKEGDFWTDKSKKDTFKYQTEFLINGGNVMQDGKKLEIEGMKKLVGDNTMVVNSFKGREQWGWGETIWHGLDPEDWFDLPKEPRAVLSLSPAGLDYYYNREMLSYVKERLREKFGIEFVHIGDPHGWIINMHSKLGDISGFEAYRDYLGRSLVYFNPTKESPMPRSRTEAMLSGCCVLSTPYQDADKFLNLDIRDIWKNSTGEEDFIKKVDPELDKDGVSGIIIPDNPIAISALINHLIYKRYATALKIGQEGKKIAKILFNKERFDQDWLKLIGKVLKEKNE